MNMIGKLDHTDVFRGYASNGDFKKLKKEIAKNPALINHANEEVRAQ